MALAPGHHVTASTNNDGSTSHQLRHFSLSKSSSPQDLRGGVLKKAPASYHTLRVRAGRSKKSTPTNHVEHHCEEGSNTDSSSTLKPPSLPPKLGLHWLDNGAELTGLKMEELVRGGHGMLLGSRIPKHYFMVKGFGESDQGDGSDPWETGSYDLALEHAGTKANQTPPPIICRHVSCWIGSINQCWSDTWSVIMGACAEKNGSSKILKNKQS